MSAAPATASLVKYESATVVTGRARRPKIAVPKLDRKTASALPATEDLLSAILPPREWTADGVLWVQHVSPTPATRIDVVNLQVRPGAGAGSGGCAFLPIAAPQTPAA
jgi:hypothetical protein